MGLAETVVLNPMDFVGREFDQIWVDEASATKGTKLVLVEDIGNNLMNLTKYEGREMVGGKTVYTNMNENIPDLIEKYRSL